MSSAIANHLWQSTLFAAVVSLLALVLRKNHAQARYWLWLIASIKFLVPFSLIVVLGGYLAPRNAATIPQPEFPGVVTEISQPFTAPAVSIAGVHATMNPLPAVLFAIWCCGFLAVIILWWTRWQRLRSAVRVARPLNMKAPVPVLSSTAPLEPGVFGLFRPVLLLPEGITDHLTSAHLRAILAHELCHVRRRDNLFAAIHMLVEAIFWFHPLVWWIGTRLVEERERACDEEVLRLGSEPQVYAESILKTCEFYLESPLACMSGVTGSDLKKRIVRIMTQHAAHRIDFSRKALLAAAGTLAVAGPLASGLLNAPRIDAQTQASAKQSFEVASIKPNNSGNGDSRWGDYRKSGRVMTINVSLRAYIQRAYGVRSYQISGPAWIKSARYDLNAEAPPGYLTEQRLQGMLQELLANRFHLVLHREEKTLPVYEIIAAKDGPKLSAGKRGVQSGISSRRGYMFGRNASMADLSDSLSQRMDRPVVDETGLKGVYNFTLQWAPEEMHSMPSAEADTTGTNEGAGPSIFTAMQEQLGLKLVPRKDSVEFLVIDRADKVPTEN